MLSRVVYKKQRGRRLLTALATLSIVTGTFVIASTALAVNPSTTGLFELDTSTTVPPCPVTTPATTVCGNANTADNPAGGADDWANVYKSATGLGSASADHAFARTFITDPVSGAENSFYTGGGSKDVNDIPQWQYGTSNDPVPDKDDIANLFAAAYTHTGSGHTILYFGMDRYDNNGDSETGFWFFENPVSLDSTGHFTGVHTGTATAPGDVLVLADWGGSNPVGDITVYQWIGGKNPLIQVADNASGDCALSGASINFCAVVNRTSDTPQWPFLDKGSSASIRPLELFEAGIDLNAVFGADRCFASFLGATRSSHSTTAQLKDFALGSFEQCGASISTQVSSTQIFVGQTVTDAATVHVAGGSTPPAPTGTVSFKVDGVAFPAAKPLSGAVNSGNDYTVTSDAYTATTTGQHCFSASWPGDTNYTSGPFVDDQTNECFTVVKRPSSTDTLSSPTGGGVTPGSSVTDTATVTSTSGVGPTPSGTVDFFLCQPATVTANGGDCSAGGAKVGVTKTLSSAGVATSDASTNTTTVGTYCWRAEYSGDSVYLASSHTDKTNECFTTTRIPSSTDTLSSPNGDIAVGGSVTDTATVTGNQGTPTGTVDFFLCQPNEVTAAGCVGPAGTKVGATKTLSSAGVATSDASTNTTTVGKYCWRAEYSGDSVYFSSSHTDSTHECFTVKDTTSATSAQNWLPNDSATITSTGGTALSGSLSFTLYSGTTCNGSILRAAETFTLTGAASPATRTTTNTTTKVLTTQDVSWLVAFTSSDPLVGNSSHCESTSLTITN